MLPPETEQKGQKIRKTGRMKTKMEERMDTMAANEKERTLEETFALLDEKIAQLENSEISLEDSFRVYKEGMELLKDCSSKIDTVEKKMLQINQDGTITEFGI